MYDRGRCSGLERDKKNLQTSTERTDCDNEASLLLHQCQIILRELDEFQSHLMKQRKDSATGFNRFSNIVKAEYVFLEKLSKTDPLAQHVAHALTTSNVPFLTSVWNTAKRSRGVVGLSQRFHYSSARVPKDCSENVFGMRRDKTSALADVVAGDGLDWIKVSTLTERRILFDLAKAGWDHDSASYEEASEGEHKQFDGHESGKLIKQIEALISASKATRVRYCHPRIRIVLPNIRQSSFLEVNNLVKELKAQKIDVQLGEELTEVRPLADVISDMAVDQFSELSTVINVDCTVLLALVSDLSHLQVQGENWHHPAILKQIEIEKVDQLLPKILWPACGSRELRCTVEAAKRMHEIVDLIGTDSEKKRTECIMNQGSTNEWTKEERIQSFQHLSTYQVPLEWNIPINIVEVDHSALSSNLPDVAEHVASRLSTINRSVFLYGWAEGITTLTSNRAAAKEIETVIENHRTCDDIKGPNIWLCSDSRSLAGKEKTRRS